MTVPYRDWRDNLARLGLSRLTIGPTTAGKNGELYLYDASYVKLKEISLGYNIPKNWLRKIGFIQSMRVSAVGRNVAILHQKTPKGIDPEATSSMGIQQGLERGFNLPTSSYGFDFKITF